MKHLSKYLLRVAMCTAILLAALPLVALAADPTSPTSFPHNVTFKTASGDVPVSFATADEAISDSTNRGVGWESGGALDKKYFLGWSPSANYETTDGAKLYYAQEKASELVKDDVTELYPVFISRLGVTGYLNGNVTHINLNKSDQDTVPGSVINTELDTNPTDHDINLYFDESRNSYELSLESSFDMNKIIAHWLYTGNGSTIMTNTQSDQGSSAKRAGYTHVDLNITIPDEVEVPEELKLTFTGYFFQPYMALDTTSRDKFEIAEVSGAEKWNITSLVSDTNPSTSFTIKNPAKSRNITVRTILRTNSAYGGKKILGVSGHDVENENMRLVAESPLTISKDKALELVGNSQKATISGRVDGYVKMPTFYFLDLSQSIPAIEAKTPVSISFSPVLVKFDKNTAGLGDSSEQNLGTSRVAYNGALNTDSFNTGTKPTATVLGDALADNPAPFDAAAGLTYQFEGWNTKPDGTGNTFTENSIVREPITVYAIYKANALTMNEAPQLVVTDKSITQGEELDVKSLIVSATDTEDGDLKNAVQVVSDGGFNKDVVGEYTVTFKVTDTQGASATKTAKITVAAKPAPQPNTPNNPTPGNPIPGTKKPAPSSKTVKPAKTAIPATGDTTNTGLYVALLGLSAMGFLGARHYKKSLTK
ncbi:DUF5011/hyalin repeat domain-containing protein [Atopobium fossor]|uniref:immunoglobulin-like domain-containing protein n=1 Tax=Atopobium fossor TaxID=39487 RepID=UPI0003F6DC25|nr:immunoglobulin-like domain-containing protein [Atopobium fossor]